MTDGKELGWVCGYLPEQIYILKDGEPCARVRGKFMVPNPLRLPLPVSCIEWKTQSGVVQSTLSGSDA